MMKQDPRRHVCEDRGTAWVFVVILNYSVVLQCLFLSWLLEYEDEIDLLFVFQTHGNSQFEFLVEAVRV